MTLIAIRRPHIATIVAGLGGTRAEILVLAYATLEIIARFLRFGRVVSIAGFGRCRTIAVSKDDFRASQAASLVYARFWYGPDGNDPPAFGDRRVCRNETILI